MQGRKVAWKVEANITKDIKRMLGKQDRKEVGR